MTARRAPRGQPATTASEAVKIVRDGVVAFALFTVAAGGSSLANSAGGVLESTDRTLAMVILAVVFSSGVAFALAFLRHLRANYVISAKRRGRRY